MQNNTTGNNNDPEIPSSPKIGGKKAKLQHDNEQYETIQDNENRGLNVGVVNAGISRAVPGPSAYPSTSRGNPGPSAYPSTSRGHPGPSAYPSTSRGNPGPSAYPSTSRGYPGPSAHPSTSRGSPRSSAYPSTSRVNPGHSAFASTSGGASGPHTFASTSGGVPGPSSFASASDGVAQPGVSYRAVPAPNMIVTTRRALIGRNGYTFTSHEVPGPSATPCTSREDPRPSTSCGFRGAGVSSSTSYGSPGPSTSAGFSHVLPGPAVSPTINREISESSVSPIPLCEIPGTSKSDYEEEEDVPSTSSFYPDIVMDIKRSTESRNYGKRNVQPEGNVPLPEITANLLESHSSGQASYCPGLDIIPSTSRQDTTYKVPVQNNNIDMPADDTDNNNSADINDINIPAEIDDINIISAELNDIDMPVEINDIDIPAEMDNSDTPAEIDDYNINDDNVLIEENGGLEQPGSGRSTPNDDNEPEGGDHDDSTDEELPWSLANQHNGSSLRSELLNEKPKNNYFIIREVLNRELGLTSPHDQSTNYETFPARFYSSLHAVRRMEKLHSLQRHDACVNSVNFHPEGRLLVSGADDANVKVWDWARNIEVHTVQTGHQANVFQSKFLNLNSDSQLNIVTCGRDGQVRLSQCSSAGGSWFLRRLAGHGKAANKLYVSPLEPFSVLSAGEDGYVLHCDLRVNTVNKLPQVRERNAAMALYSLDGHPHDTNGLVVTGRDKFVRIYDKRNMKRVVALYCPTVFTEEITVDRNMRLTTMYLTSAVYNHDGSEILGSYSDDDIYLFNVKNDVYTKGYSSKEKKGYSRRYSGHRNSATLKGVAFYGPKSEYIVSGSDCGHIYFWDKNSECIVQWLEGDARGMVNCVEAHPQFPVLASCGLDTDVKIWVPTSSDDPTFQGMGTTVRNNSMAQWQLPLFNDFLEPLYRHYWIGGNRLGVEEEDAPYFDQIQFEANMCAAI